MPAQTIITGAAYYAEGDTKALVRPLLDADGGPLDLTNADTITIRIGHATYDHYYSPHAVIVDDEVCSVEGDPTLGIVRYEPGPTTMSPPGQYHYTYRILWTDGTLETIPPNGYEALLIKTRQGGAGA